MQYLCLLTLSCSYLHAQTSIDADGLNSPESPQIYQVEIIIFQQAAPDDIKNHKLDQFFNKKADIGFTDLLAHPNPRDFMNRQTDFFALSSDYFNLKAEEKKLKNKYPIILHAAWLQNFTQSKDHTVYLDSQAIRQALMQSNQQNASSDTKPTGKATLDNHLSISGNISITLNRYFNIRSQLNINDDLDAKKYDYFESSRRMRSKFLHYLDHPSIGMLIIINPIKETIYADILDQLPEPTEDATASTSPQTDENTSLSPESTQQPSPPEELDSKTTSQTDENTSPAPQTTKEIGSAQNTT